MYKDYTAIDLETTGLNPKLDKIIEIGMVKVRNGNIIKEYSHFINPQRKLTEKTKEITGITDEDLQNAPIIKEVYQDVFAFIEDDILLGQKILFDYSFLKKVAVNYNIQFEKKGIDTLKIARKHLVDLESRTLSKLCSYYNIPLIAHRALNDARATHALYKKLTEEFEDIEHKNVCEFEPQDLIFKIKKESPIMPKQCEQLKRLIERHHMLLDYEIKSLTKGEASRLIDKILSDFGR